MIDNIKKEQYKIYGAVSLFLIFIAIGFIFAVFPNIRGIVYNSDEIQKKRIDNEINQKGIEKIPEMDKLMELFQQKKNNLEILLNAGEEVNFFKHIESLALETGNGIEIKISENENSQPKKDKKTKDISILGNLPYAKYTLMELTLFGNYENLLKFLGKLEKNDKYVNVIGLDIYKMEIEDEPVNVFNSKKDNESEVQKKEILQSSIKLVVYIND